MNKHYLGHRLRLRKKFLETGGNGVVDYELLELLLFGAIPRSDTKPLAKRLVCAFGSLRETLEASPEELLKISGMGEATTVMIKLCYRLGTELLKDKISDASILNGWRQVVDYCQAKMSHLKKEQIRILFLNHKNYLIQDEVHQEGTIDHATIYTREVVKRALALGASNLILVHNHPTGDPTPSQADILITRKIKAAIEVLDIHLLDHLIIGRGRYVSLRARGVLCSRDSSSCAISSRGSVKRRRYFPVSFCI